jgi:hypothetical protein
LILGIANRGKKGGGEKHSLTYCSPRLHIRNAQTNLVAINYSRMCNVCVYLSESPFFNVSSCVFYNIIYLFVNSRFHLLSVFFLFPSLSSLFELLEIIYAMMWRLSNIKGFGEYMYTQFFFCFRLLTSLAFFVVKAHFLFSRCDFLLSWFCLLLFFQVVGWGCCCCCWE